MYTEIFGNSCGRIVFVSFETTKNLQISNNGFSYRKDSADGVHKEMGCLRIELLLSDDTRGIRYIISRNGK